MTGAKQFVEDVFIENAGRSNHFGLGLFVPIMDSEAAQLNKGGSES